MKIQQAAFTQPVLSQPPGTVIVGLSNTGLPLAVGVKLSADPDQRLAEFRALASHLVDHADKVGDVANVLSTGVDLAANLHPAWTAQASVYGDVFALFATGVGTAAAVRKGDKLKAVISSIECGAAALNILADSGVVGSGATLKTVALVAKLSGAGLTVFHTDPPPRPMLTPPRPPATP